MSEFGDKTLLSVRTVGQVKILSEEAVQRIVEQAGLPLRAGLNHPALAPHLNELIDFTLFRMLSPSYDRRVFNDLTKHYKEYERLSRELANSRDFPPRPCQNWYREAEEWFQLMEQRFAERARGGAPRKVQHQYLFPRAIGLFASAYALRPVSTTRNEAIADGPTARFMRELLRQIDKTLATASFDNIYSEDEIAKLRNFKTTDAALRKNINTAIKEDYIGVDGAPARSQASEQKWPEGKTWGRYAASYDEFL
jgi:hypothetical protein